MSEYEPILRSAHFVVFHESDAELVEAVTGFFADGAPDAIAIVVATPEHQRLLAGRMRGAQMLDAATLLRQFSHDGVIDAAAFDDSVGELIRSASAEGRPVRVFGEMVALLWDQGLVAQAIELELLWTALADTVAFDLLCAYPSTLVLDHDEPAPVNLVCAAHDVHAVRAFVPEPHSVADARRFVLGAASTASSRQIDKLLLIVSELATNAMEHACTPFVVEVATIDNAVCISVRDQSKIDLSAKSAPMDSECGRGLELVDALADAWGVRWTAVGKAVWAEVAQTET